MDCRRGMLFLARYRWIFSFRVTHILSPATLHQIPEPWLKLLLTLNLETFNRIFVDGEWGSEELPQCVANFLHELAEIQFRWPKSSINRSKLPAEASRGLTPKKEHELVNFSHIILAECANRGISHVVDAGSGVGHLARYLSRAGMPRITAIEGNASHHNKAEERGQGVEHWHQRIDQTAVCLAQLQERLGRSAAALVGLHCCGDLTPSLLKICKSVECIKMAAILSCCYHKMALPASFPLAAANRNLLEKEPELEQGNGFINECMLRLAAQETLARWKNMSAADHEEHMRHVVLRAVLQLWADRHGLLLMRRRRRPVCRQGRDADLESFIASLGECYDLGSVDWDYGTELRTIYAEQQHLFGMTELLTGLQFLLQGLVEGIVLEDRRLYIEEEQSFTGQILEIFDEELSPRNKLLLVHRK